MVIPGWRRYNLSSRKLKRIICKHCNSQDSITVFIYSLYLDIWYIPFCSLGKRGNSNCSNCNETLKPKEMPLNLRVEFQNYKRQIKIPIWQFFGLFILAIVIAWFTIQISEDKANELMYIDKPELQDTYEYQINENRYSTLKIIDIKSDSIYFTKNYLTKPRRHKVYLIDKEYNYSDSIVKYSRKDVKMMFQKNIIFAINRK